MLCDTCISTESCDVVNWWITSFVFYVIPKPTFWPLTFKHICLSILHMLLSHTATMWTTDSRCNLWYQQAKTILFTHIIRIHDGDPQMCNPWRRGFVSIQEKVMLVLLTWPQHSNMQSKGSYQKLLQVEDENFTFEWS